MLHVKDMRKGPESGEIRYSLIHLAFGIDEDGGWVGDEPPDFDDSRDPLYPAA
jgi:hypothetical protein